MKTQKPIKSEENKQEEIGLSVALPKNGETVDGQIIGNDHNSVYIDLGPIGTGIIYGREFYAAKNILRKLKPEDKVKAKVIEVDNENGYIELSLRDAQKETSWDGLKKAKEDDLPVIIKIEGANKGGLLGEANGIKGFLPLSQLSMENYPRVKNGDTAEILKRLQKFIGQKLSVKVLDISPEEEKLIFSEKALTSKNINQLLKEYKIGDVVTGQITGIADFGAFIKFPVTKKNDSEEETPQAEGLIHISELDWQLIDDISDIVKVNDIVKAKIIDITEDAKVSLSLKALKKDPWEDVEKKYKKGDIIKGKIIKINQLGAFVEVSSKIRGLLHLSSFGSKDKIEEPLSQGKTYKFEIISLDAKTHKMGLSLAEDKEKTKS